MTGTVPKRSGTGAIWNLVLGCAVLAAWAVVFTALLAGGRYRLYLMPKLWPLLAMGLAILVVAFVARFTMGGGDGSSSGGTDSGAGHGPHLKALWVRAGLLVLPLCYLGAVHGESLGAYAFNKRQVPGLPDPSLVSTLDALDRAEGDAVEMDLDRLVWNYIRLSGKKVITLGQVARDDTLPEGHFILFRFVITCCVADAQPAAVLVQSKAGPLPEENAWVRIKGALEVKQVSGRSALVVRTDQVKEIEEPMDIYLYAF